MRKNKLVSENPNTYFTSDKLHCCTFNTLNTSAEVSDLSLSTLRLSSLCASGRVMADARQTRRLAGSINRDKDGCKRPHAVTRVPRCHCSLCCIVCRGTMACWRPLSLFRQRLSLHGESISWWRLSHTCHQLIDVNPPRFVGPRSPSPRCSHSFRIDEFQREERNAPNISLELFDINHKWFRRNYLLYRAFARRVTAASGIWDQTLQIHLLIDLNTKYRLK